MQSPRSGISSRSLILLLVFVFFMLWLPRASGLDAFVYVDEPSWMQRSANFFYALRHREFSRTLQNLSPGVTTMWAGTFAFLLEDPGYALAAPGYFGETVSPETGKVHYLHKYNHLESFLLDRGIDPLDILTTTRAITVLLISLALTFAFYFAWRLFGVWPSLVAFALLSFEPFYLVNSRFAHLDGLMSAFLLLSLLAFMNYLYLENNHSIAIVISSLAGATAYLSKQPGIIIIPTMIALLVLHHLDLRLGVEFATRFKSLMALRFHIKPMLLWGIVFIIAIFIAFPAMWVNPSGVFAEVFLNPIRFLVASSGVNVEPMEAIEIISERGIDTISRDWLFYPQSYLWRTTPLIIGGLLLGMIAYLRRWNILSQQNPRRAFSALWVFALIFGFFISLSLKMSIRYYLPFYLTMAILSGLGWYAAAIRSASYLKIPLAQNLAPVLLSLVVAGQMLSSLPLYPYYTPYYNLLLGGNARASQNQYSAFGEGLDLAAAYLNQKSGASDLDVISWYAFGSFSSYFDGNSHDMQILIRDIDNLAKVDYLVTYRNSWKRVGLADFFAVLEAVPPEHTVELFGVPYARIYAVSDLPLEAFHQELLP